MLQISTLPSPLKHSCIEPEARTSAGGSGPPGTTPLRFMQGSAAVISHRPGPVSIDR
jgi:hypothetical protein